MQTVLIPDHANLESVAEAIALLLHEEELGEVEVYNEGWGVSANGPSISIASKTAQGILTTDFDASTGEVRHRWEN